MCPVAFWGLSVRDRAVIQALGPIGQEERWTKGLGGRSQDSLLARLQSQQLFYIAGPFSCLGSLHECSVLSKTCSLPGLAWEPPSYMLAALSKSAGAWLSQCHLVPVFCVQEARSVFLGTPASWLPGTPCRSRLGSRVSVCSLLCPLSGSSLAIWDRL